MPPDVNPPLLLRYTQALITQIAQTGICIRYHSVEQQLRRWLLLTLDRLSSQELVMTQELIAHILDVRREGITGIAGKLKQAGLFASAGAILRFLSRRAWRKAFAECYNVVKKEFDRLFDDVREYRCVRPVGEIPLGYSTR